jgi:lipoprotein-anchoring transpeptidase ErfK/SrfK
MGRFKVLTDWAQPELKTGIVMMKSRIAMFAVVLGGLMLSGCMEATFEAASDTGLKPRDRELLARASYAKVDVPAPFKRAIVSYHRKEAPGSIVIDSDNHFLYYVLADGKAIRYGVTVGEEALSFSGIARIGSMQEWPRWIPTADIHKRIAGLPAEVKGGPDNPLGARALYLYQGNRDTLFRIHGTNQPEYIGASISSGCIRMTNEDVIDLYNRVKLGAIVVVLDRKEGDSPFNSQIALQGGAAF